MDTDAITWVDVDPALFDSAPRPTTPFLDLVGFQPTSIATDRVEGFVELDDRHQQTYGIVHGGVHAAVVETVCSIGGAAAVAAEGMGVVGVSNTTDFVRAIRAGRVEVVATPVHAGRTQHLWRASLTRADGKLVATGQVRLHVVDPTRLPT